VRRFPGHSGTPAGGAIEGIQQTSLGTLALGVGDPSGNTYTTTGAKTLGGVEFELFGVNASNTWVVDDESMSAVGGSAVTYAVVELAGHFPTLDLTLPFSFVARLTDGTIASGVSGAEIFVYIGSLADRCGVARNGIDLESVTFPGGAKANHVVDGATNCTAIGGDVRARGITSRYWLDGDTISTPSSGRVGRTMGADYGAITAHQAVIGFIGSAGRSKGIISLELFQDTEAGA